MKIHRKEEVKEKFGVTPALPVLPGGSGYLFADQFAA
jgi:hypothetical protein